MVYFAFFFMVYLALDQVFCYIFLMAEVYYGGERGHETIILERTKHITPFKVFILAKSDTDGIKEITG